MYIEDSELKKFVDDWWAGFVVYDPSQKQYVDNIFQVISKEHFIDFLRDALAELSDN